MDIASLTILEAAPWPALLLDKEGQIIIANKSGRSLLGISPLARPTIQSLLSTPEGSDTVGVLLSQLESAGSRSLLKSLRVRAGAYHLYSLASSTVNVDGDVYQLLQLFAAVGEPPAIKPEVKPEVAPEMKREPSPLENSVFLKQKLDCALQLTRTVSLDFNNALTSILGHTSHLLDLAEPKHPWRTSLLAVEKSAERAAEIAHDLAAFSRQEKDTRSHVAGNINTLVRQTVDLLQKSLPPGVKWRLDLKKKLLAAEYDEAKMQQAILKVLDNAVQAVGETGTISIRTTNVQIENDDAGKPFGIQSGSYVRIELSDDGPGIPHEMLPRVFEPFFTTKPNPPHRGLGLTWVYGIVTNHGGRVAIQNEPCRGCSVSIHLPSLKTLVTDTHERDEDLERTGAHTILMVDDEEVLLTMGETILSSYGYSVLTATNGEEALRLFKSSADSIDLVITDIVMPNMSGRELIEKLRVLAPDLKIICSSGYVPPAHKRPTNGTEEQNFLQKPFTSRDLLRKVKQALSRSP